MNESTESPRPVGPDWLPTAIAYQIYPLGFCGAPAVRPGGAAEVVHRLPRITGWLDHIVSLGANVLILNPLFDSVSHGYDTLDHLRIDPRLGDEADMDALIAACRERGIRIVLDGVFNHVSEQHPIVRAALAAGPGTPEGEKIRWSGEHPYGFEGNSDLVELNLRDTAVQELIAGAMLHWLERGIDGWRLDAMYAASPEGWAPIIARVLEQRPDAWILGEVIHGDYAAFAQVSGAQSITQYELWKAIWSSLRETNLWELAHALGRHQEFRDGGGLTPLTFLSNHDTTRIASQIPDGRDLAVAYALLALLPGVPAVYAGDEFGAAAIKEERAGGDDGVRPVFPDDPAAVFGAPQGTPADVDPERAQDETTFPPLTLLKPDAAPRILEVHRRLLGLRRRFPWLASAQVAVRQDVLANEYAEIELTGTEDDERLVLALNLTDDPRPAPSEVLDAVSGADMLDGTGPAGPGMVPAHGAAVVR